MSRKQEPEAPKRRRTGNKPWKRIYGVDRAFTARVDRAKARGQYTPPKPKDS